MSSRAEFGLAEGSARKVLWKPIIAVLICALAAVAVMFWPRAEQGKENEATSQPPAVWPDAGEGFEYVRYWVSIKVVSIEGAERIENVLVRIIYPYFMESLHQLDPAYENIKVEALPAPISGRKVLILDRWVLFSFPPRELEIYLSNVYPNDQMKVDVWIRAPKENSEKLTLRKYENYTRVDFLDVTPDPKWKPGMPGATFTVSGSLELSDRKGYIERWEFRGAETNALEPILLHPIEARWLGKP